MHSQAWGRARWALILSVLTCFTLTVHGFHPMSEDGGLYAAGIYLKLDSALFPYYKSFVRGPMHYSQFAAVMALIARGTRLSVAWAIFLTYLATTWLMLFAARQILRRCTDNAIEQLGGLALLATWWTLPVAGTSLVMMDPYLTARSFSTPLTLLALAYAMDNWKEEDKSHRRNGHPAIFCGLCIVTAAVMHLLMAVYALAFVVVMRVCMLKQKKAGFAVVVLTAFCIAAFLHLLAPPESNAWLAAEVTRYYWFLSQWHWYEIAGLVGPIAILTIFALSTPRGWTDATLKLCQCAIVMGGIAFAIALLFARENASVHVVARLQPLRTYLPIYALMSILLGAALVWVSRWAASHLEQRMMASVTRYAAGWLIPCIAIGMYAAQRDLYSRTPHLELPWSTEQNTNPWVQAFLWIRANTPNNDLFALDAHYITAPGEDAQTFRAISLRDSLPDYSKDGGEAAIAGNLASAWAAGSQAQLNLDKKNDAERQRHLLPFGVTWIVLQSASSTLFPCPYNNGAIKVCRLDRLQ